MKLLTNILTILFFVQLLSCNGQGIKDTNFVKEIPSFNNGEPDLFYLLTNQKSKQLKLDNLENGFDSLQIRIWYDYSLTTLRELVILKFSDSKWTGLHYRIEVDWNPFNLSETIIKSDITELNPKSGWTEFINEMIELQIMSLPDMYDIEGLVDGWTDGITYNIEIGTKNNYRFYGYHLPEKFLESWQAKNMVNILELIKNEFGIDWK